MKKLHKYLSLSTATFGYVLTNGAIVYTDVDPDVYLNSNEENFFIDFNYDGKNDYELFFDIDNLGGGGGYGPPIDIYKPKIKGLLGNKIGGYFRNGGGFQNPALPANFIEPYYSSSYVNSSLEWYGGDVIFGYYFYFGGGYGYGGGPESEGKWSGLSERFVALRFTIDGNTHYGWVRCSIDSDYKGIIIHDYAYNDTPNTPIKMGVTYDENYVAKNIVATDVKNKHNGLDLNVTFEKANDESGISEYRLIAVKSTETFSVGKANGCSHYKSIVPTGTDIDVNFNEFSKDSDGDLIVEGVSYKVYVLSTPDLVNLTSSNLSLQSNEITLSSTVGIDNSIFNKVNYFLDGKSLVIKSDIKIDNLNILNLNGKNIYNQQNIINSTFDMSIVSKGIYLIQIEIENHIKVIKIIIP